mgnify:CR=1 FL=1
MAKNKFIIEQHKALEKLRKLTRQNVAEIYSAFCKVLIDEGKSPEEVTELFNKTQECWNELVANNECESMVKWCEEVTGITLVEE